MTEIMVRCRGCGAMMPTGVDMAPDLFKISEVEGGTVSCPACNQTQPWGKSEAYFLS